MLLLQAPGGCAPIRPAPSGACRGPWLLRAPRSQRIRAAASQQDLPDGVPSWVNNLNRNNIQGPEGSQPKGPGDVPPLSGPEIMGEKGWREWQDVKRTERQRMWDSMRASAQERYEQGVMPDWFDPNWLSQEESPVNKILREQGDPAYQYDDRWLGRSYDNELIDPETQGGGDDDDDGGSGKDRRGKGWWRNDDPYWMLRDWGSHPMRWWTLVFAGIIAAGGLLNYLVHNSAESLLVGWPAAAWLALCALAMSDMRTGTSGELGVKAAWAACAFLAWKDGVWGWAHKLDSGRQAYDYYQPEDFIQRHTEKPPWAFLNPTLPHFKFSAFGWTAVGMCTMLMWTGMNGEVDGSLPVNPGAVYKTDDVIFKHRVWKRWGYGDEAMRV